MTTYSKADLATKALREVGLYAPDEAIEGQDQEDAEEKASALVETLRTRGMAIPNGSVNAVPEDWYIPLAQYVGMWLMPSYGGQAPTRQQLDASEAIFREMVAKPETGSIAGAEYF